MDILKGLSPDVIFEQLPGLLKNDFGNNSTIADHDINYVIQVLMQVVLMEPESKDDKYKEYIKKYNFEIVQHYIEDYLDYLESLQEEYEEELEEHNFEISDHEHHTIFVEISKQLKTHIDNSIKLSESFDSLYIPGIQDEISHIIDFCEHQTNILKEVHQISTDLLFKGLFHNIHTIEDNDHVITSRHEAHKKIIYLKQQIDQIQRQKHQLLGDLKSSDKKAEAIIAIKAIPKILEQKKQELDCLLSELKESKSHCDTHLTKSTYSSKCCSRFAEVVEQLDKCAKCLTSGENKLTFHPPCDSAIDPQPSPTVTSRHKSSTP